MKNSFKISKDISTSTVKDNWTWHVMGYCPPPPKQKYPQIGNPPVLNVFTPPLPVLKLFPPPSPPTGYDCFCIFHTWWLPVNTCSYFWSYFNWLNAVINDFLKSWNNTLKKHVFTIIIILYFLCVMTYLSLTLREKL